jgi:hypothetical protein
LFSGLPVNRVKLKVYAFSGFTAGIAAMIMLGYYGSASSDAGKGYELDVIAAAVVGGAGLLGGRGTALGALLGALIIQMINNGIVILNIDQNYSQIIIGAVIVLAVLLDRINGACAKTPGAGRRDREGNPSGGCLSKRTGHQNQNENKTIPHKHGRHFPGRFLHHGCGQKQNRACCNDSAGPKSKKANIRLPWWPRASRIRFSRPPGRGPKMPLRN